MCNYFTRYSFIIVSCLLQSPMSLTTTFASFTSNSVVVDKGLLTLYEDLPLYCLFLCQIVSNPLPLPPPPPHPTPHTHTQTHTLFLLCYFGWISHHAIANVLILLSDIIVLNLLSLGTLVLVAPCCVFYATRHQICWSFNTDDVVFASTLIWYHTNTHNTQAPIDLQTYTNIY